MIAYIRGRVLTVQSDYIVLETGGVGYQIYCSAQALASVNGKREGEVYTYMLVKEDGITLYGFASMEEKNMFLKLVSVSGVGPKMGIAVLSAMNINEVASAIALSDVKKLSTVKGLGKKTAERIILELREKVAAMDVSAKGGADVLAPVGSADEDAVLGLMTMGFTRAESAQAIARAKAGGAIGVEEIIYTALRSLAK